MLLTESRLQSVTGVEGELALLVQRCGAEFHFPRLEQQIDTVRQELKRSSAWRQEHWAKKAALEAVYSNGEGDAPPKKDCTVLHTGDFYLTKHSNLCETHVVFHMVVDDTLDNLNISSRHPVVIGLRSVLKTACLHDVTSLTVPLLLSHRY